MSGFKVTTVICHMDVDSFECQVYGRNMYNYKSPCVVVNQSGVILAVNYPAKNKGITRSMRENNLPKNGVSIFRVPNHHKWGKPEQSLKRSESNKIRDCIQNYVQKYPKIVFEVSSTDEFFFDFTEEITLRIEKSMRTNESSEGGVPAPLPKYSLLPKTMVFEGTKKITGNEIWYRISNVYKRDLKEKNLSTYMNEVRFFYGVQIANEISQKIKTALGYDVSFGISSSKLVAKLACSKNKPCGFTILTPEGFPRASKSIAFTQIPGLGSFHGGEVKRYFQNANFPMWSISDLSTLSFYELSKALPKVNFNIVNKIVCMSRGIDDGEQVTNKLHFASVGCNRKIYGPSITQMEDLRNAILFLCEEMEERLFEEREWNKRIGKVLSVELSHANYIDNWRKVKMNPFLTKNKCKIDIEDLSRKACGKNEKFDVATAMLNRISKALLAKIQVFRVDFISFKIFEENFVKVK